MATGNEFRRYAGYGVGDFGLNIYWNALSLVLMFWYAEVVGLSPAVAGAIYFVGMAWDAVTDAVVASLSERTRSRFGTYRPHILFGGGALGLSFCLLFWIPPLEGMALIAVLTAAHVLFRTVYTIVAVPYSALASRLSYDSVERTTFSGVRMFFAFAGLLTVSGLWFPLVRHFGGGEDTAAAGFQAAAVIGALVATIALMLCFAGTREKPPPGRCASARPPSIWRFILAIRDNHALAILLMMIFLQSGAVASLLIPLSFFIDVNAPVFARKEVVMTAYATATLASIPVWTVFIRRFGKKAGWALACVLAILCGLDLAISGARVVAGVPLQIIGYGAAFGAFGVLVWSFVPDTVEYGQWKTGERNEGAVFGSVLLVQKLSGGLMGLFVGFMLSQVGYDIDATTQSAATVDGIRFHIFLMPSLLLALSTLLILKLPLNRTLHARIVGQIGGSK
ncbi:MULTISPECIES: MFS transporter [Maricaulis]|uniref:GPH family glycoside/pentoside/hexuronide:cation symporter n=1 Tax=Maricaulis maris TaxID=74318 RepID=A0A495D3K0_9PROT|nr:MULTISPECIES: glycoside-pentoside-hexuronide (GPH):cation symporter [Maricaulis]RKQ96486.1 GPH family glycoside/pentoside/hexuronide:cation symporter [Maricaulis maris]